MGKRTDAIRRRRERRYTLRHEVERIFEQAALDVAEAWLEREVLARLGFRRTASAIIESVADIDAPLNQHDADLFEAGRRFGAKEAARDE